MKTFLSLVFLLLQQTVFAGGFNKEWYYSHPNPSVFVDNLYTEVISPETDSAVIAFDWVNVYFEPSSVNDDWEMYMVIENTSDEQVYVNFPQATAIVDGSSAHLYYRRYYSSDDFTAYAFELLPHTFSYYIYVQPNISLDLKDLRIEAKKYGVDSEESKHYVTFNLPITNAATMETEIYEIKFEVKWVDKKYLKENDFFRPEKTPGRAYYFPRTVYEALQNRPVTE